MRPWSTGIVLPAAFWVLLAVPGLPWAQTAPPVDQPPPNAETAPAPRQNLTPAVAAEPPAVSCYRAATAPQRDAYVCDLAVQVARDGGSPAALAAALTNRALVLAGEGRLEPALADLEAAQRQTPNDPAVHGNRGNLLLRLKRPAEALAAHNRAVELAPEDPREYYNRAFSYLALGDPGRAEEDVAAARTLLERQVPGARVRGRETPARNAGRVR
jgi:tetratricopeptide (TPR) repeat protein